MMMYLKFKKQHNYVTGFDKTRLPHMSRFKNHNSKLSLSNFDLLLHNAMRELCENCTDWLMVKVDEELDVCGSLHGFVKSDHIFR